MSPPPVSSIAAGLFGHRWSGLRRAQLVQPPWRSSVAGHRRAGLRGARLPIGGRRRPGPCGACVTALRRRAPPAQPPRGTALRRRAPIRVPVAPLRRSWCWGLGRVTEIKAKAWTASSIDVAFSLETSSLHLARTYHAAKAPCPVRGGWFTFAWSTSTPIVYGGDFFDGGLAMYFGGEGGSCLQEQIG